MHHNGPVNVTERYWSPSTDGGTVDQVYRLRFVADEILHRRQESSILPRAEIRRQIRQETGRLSRSVIEVYLVLCNPDQSL